MFDKSQNFLKLSHVKLIRQNPRFFLTLQYKSSNIFHFTCLKFKMLDDLCTSVWRSENIESDGFHVRTIKILSHLSLKSMIYVFFSATSHERDKSVFE